MKTIQTIKNNVLSGESINKDQALFLADAPLAELCKAANEIREFFCGKEFDICTIINGKSGRCSEDCKYCAQSVLYKTEIDNYPLLETDKLVANAKHNEAHGVLRYSIVTSGKKLSDEEVEQVSKSIEEIKKHTKTLVCASFGLLDETQFKKLKSAGATRVHNNLETSRNFFPNICTTHTYDDQIDAIQAAQRSGLSVCSGGIMGLGEGMEDRIDMALTLRELDIHSIPINLLNPIPGTPYEGHTPLENDEMTRIVAIYRFILPKAFIRLGGGRGLLPDQGKKCFQSGANAVISGNLLTTAGSTIDDDMKMIKDLGFKVV